MVSGRDGSSSSNFHAAQQPVGLQQHDSSCDRPGCETSTRARWCTNGYFDRCLSALHPKHLWCDSIHSFDLGRWHRWSFSGFLHCVVLLLRGKWSFNNSIMDMNWSNQYWLMGVEINNDTNWRLISWLTV